MFNVNEGKKSLFLNRCNNFHATGISSIHDFRFLIHGLQCETTENQKNMKMKNSYNNVYIPHCAPCLIAF